MESTSKAFKRCVDPCPRYLTLDDTHNLCVFCLGEEHARDVLVGEISMKKLRSRLFLFSRKEWQPSTSRDSGPTVAEAWRRMRLWGSQVDLADELERELCFSRLSAENKGKLLDDDDEISLTSSDPVASALLGYAQEEQEMFEGEEVETEPSQSSCPKICWKLWNTPRRGLTCRGSGPRWWRCGVVSMSIIFLAIIPSSNEPFISS